MVVNESHLYKGFKYVSFLESIKTQRLLQCSLIKNICSSIYRDRRFLSLGTAYGDELAFFAREGVLDCWTKIVGIDIVADVEKDVFSQPDLVRFHDQLSFKQLDLQQLPPPFGENYWDCIQCGFVLEDIEYHNKQSVYSKLFHSLNDRGILIVSEMFVDNKKRSNGTDALRRQQMSDLYDYFLAEAMECLTKGSLTNGEYNLLCGNGQGLGLLSTKAMAIDGARDYFETYEQTKAHLLNAGFHGIDYYVNPAFSLLGVITARKG